MDAAGQLLQQTLIVPAAPARTTMLLAAALVATLLLARLSPWRPFACTVAVAVLWTAALLLYQRLHG